MRVFGTPASIDVQASVWRMFLMGTSDQGGSVGEVYFGYKWNRMYEGFGTLVANNSSWGSSTIPGQLNASFSISPNNSYIGNTFVGGTVRAKARAFIKSGL